MASQDNTSPTPEPSETQLLAPQPDSPFFNKFPGELRNRIYRLVLLDNGDIPIHAEELGDNHQETGEALNQVTSQIRSHPSTHRLKLGHPLLQVCKQTGHEASEIYYLENTFEVTSSVFAEPQALEKLDHALRPWAAKMTALGVCHERSLTKSSNDQGSGDRYMHVEFIASRYNGFLFIQEDTPTTPDGPVAVFSSHPSYWGYCVSPQKCAICLCKVQRCASEQGSEDVVRFVTKTYAQMVRKIGYHETFYIPNCWTCARHDVFSSRPPKNGRISRSN